jgi:hypothetical protein
MRPRASKPLIIEMITQQSPRSGSSPCAHRNVRLTIPLNSHFSTCINQWAMQGLVNVFVSSFTATMAKARGDKREQARALSDNKSVRWHMTYDINVHRTCITDCPYNNDMRPMPVCPTLPYSHGLPAQYSLNGVSNDHPPRTCDHISVLWICCFPDFLRTMHHINI